MNAFITYVVSTSLVAVFILTAKYSSSADAKSPSCSALASNALAGVADGLSSTWGSGDHPENRRVLKSALASSAALRACGDAEASISGELIAADAYGDVYPNQPALRCAALRDARTRLRLLGDVRRARLVSITLTACH